MFSPPRFRLQREQLLPRPVPEAFAFFAEAANLQAITPEFLDFRILTPLPLELREGALLDYRLRLWGVPFGWRTRIESWEPPARFTDRQLRGPYTLWHHTHEFRAVPGGTAMTDVVDYALPLGPLGHAAHALLVRRTLRAHLRSPARPHRGAAFRRRTCGAAVSAAVADRAVPRGGLVLVTGATGYVGGRLVPRLLAHGFRVRLLVRDPARLDVTDWPGVEVVRGDVLEPGTLAPALAGCDLAYYLIHSMAAGEAGFSERDRRAAGNFGAAARAAGVRRLIYLGGLGRVETGLSPHLASRQQTGEVLRAAGGVPVVELRAAVIVGSGSISFEMIRYLVERVPVLIAPRWTATRCQPIAIRDVLAYLVAAAELPFPAGAEAEASRILEVGGRDVLTYGEMLLACARVRGLRRWLVNVPVLTPRLSSLWVDLVTPIPAALARPLIEGLRNEVVVHDGAARVLFAQVTPLGYEEAVRLAFERQTGGGLETVWSGSRSSAFDRAPVAVGSAPVESAQLEGLIVERRERRVSAPAAAVFAVCSGLGGRRGWLYADLLWDLRGLLDRLVGGPGMRRGRRDPDVLRPGDACDFWRVELVERGRRVRLGAEMKLPGRAWLELAVEELPGEAGSVLRTTAIFEPRGLPGLLYWYGLLPFHKLLFAGMVRAIAAAAESAPPAGASRPESPEVVDPGSSGR